MRAWVLLIGLVVCAPCFAMKAATKPGYVACFSKRDLEDMVAFSAAGDRRSFNAYLARKKCILVQKAFPVTVTEWPGMFGGKVEYVFNGVRLWSVREALDYSAQ